jgi:DNA-binding SARP family transcriptional activator/tetratricopeptide (TPR) repeat protein
MSDVEFRLLGPVETRVGGTPLGLGPPRQRLVLAALLVDAGRPVGWDLLVDRVWADAPPAGARGVLRANVARLRTALAPAGGVVRLGRGSGGYLIDVDPDRVDVHRFDRLAGRGGAGSVADVGRLRAALDLWRGEPLAGLRGRWVEQTRQLWWQRWLAAAVSWAEAATAAGSGAAAVEPLFEAVRRFPLAENAVAALMRALAATGRPAEALTLFAKVRTRLVEELGAHPGPVLRAAHKAVLREEVVVGGAGPPRVVPAQLPADVAGFAGRADDLARLDGLLADGPAAGRTVVLSVVSGLAGVGKTALAVHWAHRVADRFPDGVLYVNLRGFDPGGRVVPPGEAIRGFLDALGVPPDAVPSTLDGMATHYRGVMAGRRMLVVLDNARDADQVRPLLPGSPTVAVLVTSRNDLMSLVATDGAQPLPLGTFSPAEAHDLLVRRLDPATVAADAGAVRQIIRSCAGLPLALAIAAARARVSRLPLAAVAADLDAGRGRLDVLDAGDPASEVRAVFSWSYAALGPAAARLFRLLGLHPADDISRAAAAALAGVTVTAVRPPLTELVRASLVTEPTLGRFAVHDLVRAYAAELADTVDGPDATREALVRLLDQHARTAHAADVVINPARGPLPGPPAEPVPYVHPVPLADLRAATDWFAAELRVLYALIRFAAATGFDLYCWRLAWSLDTFLHRQGDKHVHADIWAEALPAALRLGDPAVAAWARRALAHAYIRQGRPGDAERELTQALGCAAGAGAQVAQARIAHSLAFLCNAQGRWDAALAHVERALALHLAAGDRRGEALSRNAIGWYLAQGGDHRAALAQSRQAIGILQELGDRDSEASAWDSVGFAHHQLGEHAAAVACFQQALALFRLLEDRYLEADILVHLGQTQQAMGDGPAARTSWQAALDILTELDHPDADAVRARLAGPAVTAR